MRMFNTVTTPFSGGSNPIYVNLHWATKISTAHVHFKKNKQGFPD